MRLLQGDAFNAVFRNFERDAFHLELSDAYDVEEEAGPLRAFLRGEPDDYAWISDWLDVVRRATEAGKSFRRVRVVTVPHGDYTRWLAHISDLNIGAGEEIRWMPRATAAGLKLGCDDFWLFDDRLVMFNLVDPAGRARGAAATTNPAIVEHCRLLRERVWSVATPHDVYLKYKARLS